MKLGFAKMQGTGNDFIVLDGRKMTGLNWGDLSHRLCRRRYGVGADQMLVLTESRRADFGMRIFNADGSEVEMCGNGIRCLCLYLRRKGLTEKDGITFDTLNEVVTAGFKGNEIEVNMGQPLLDAEKVPVDLGGRVLSHPIEVNGKTLHINCISMGNPHCVVRVKDVERYPVNEVGPSLENHQLFPAKTNVEFIEIVDRNILKSRVWERGSGETLACGSGACAIAVVSKLNDWTEGEVRVDFPGGPLSVHWREEGVFLRGPAAWVFEGEVEI